MADRVSINETPNDPFTQAFLYDQNVESSTGEQDKAETNPPSVLINNPGVEITIVEGSGEIAQVVDGDQRDDVLVYAGIQPGYTVNHPAFAGEQSTYTGEQSTYTGEQILFSGNQSPTSCSTVYVINPSEEHLSAQNYKKTSTSENLTIDIRSRSNVGKIDVKGDESEIILINELLQVSGTESESFPDIQLQSVPSVITQGVTILQPSATASVNTAGTSKLTVRHINEENKNSMDKVEEGSQSDHCIERPTVKNKDTTHVRERKSETKKYTCTLCCKEFKNINLLLIHRASRHCVGDIMTRLVSLSDKMPMLCRRCGQRFKTKASLHAHRRVHQHGAPYKCVYCDAQFVFQAGLLKHLPLCGTLEEKKRVKKYQHHILRSSINQRNGKSPLVNSNFYCYLCSRCFLSQSALTSHKIKMHNKISKPSKQQKYAIGFQVLDTRKLSVLERQKLSFKENEFLNVNYVVNEKEIKRSKYLPLYYDMDEKKHGENIDGKVYQCLYCRQCFREIQEVRKHVKVHKTVCSDCGKKTLGMPGLRRHRLKVHGSKRDGIFECLKCKKKYGVKSEFLRHMKDHVGPWVCERLGCGAQFTERSELVSHRKGHRNPHPNQGHHNPHPDQGHRNPHPDQGHRNTHPDQGHHNPHPDQGHHNPHPDQGHHNPHPDQGHHNPHPDQGHRNPHPDQGMAVADSTISEKDLKGLTLQTINNYIENKETFTDTSYGRVLAVARCKLCHEQFTNTTITRKHIKMVHLKDGSKKFKCDKCEFSTHFGYHFKEHQKKHNKPFSCNICARTYNTLAQLDKHLPYHNKDKYQCFYCSKLFVTKTKCIEHINVFHSDERQQESKSEDPTISTDPNAGESAVNEDTHVQPVPVNEDIHVQPVPVNEDIHVQHVPVNEDIHVQPVPVNADVILQPTLDNHVHVETRLVNTDEGIPAEISNDDIDLSGTINIDRDLEQEQDKVEGETQLDDNAAILAENSHHHEPMTKTHQQDKLVEHWHGVEIPQECSVETVAMEGVDLISNDSENNIQETTTDFQEIPGNATTKKKPSVPFGLEEFAPVCTDFGCAVCGEKFKLEADVLGHLIQSYTTLSFCNLCKTDFGSNLKLDQHMLLKHGTGKSFSCPDCGRKFLKERTYWNHVEKHTGRFSCHICEGKAFTNKSDLQRHLELHSAKVVACMQCGEVLENTTQLAIHKYREHGLKVKRPNARKYKSDATDPDLKDKLELEQILKEICLAEESTVNMEPNGLNGADGNNVAYIDSQGHSIQNQAPSRVQPETVMANMKVCIIPQIIEVPNSDVTLEMYADGTIITKDKQGTNFSQINLETLGIDLNSLEGDTNIELLIVQSNGTEVKVTIQAQIEKCPIPPDESVPVNTQTDVEQNDIGETTSSTQTLYHCSKCPRTFKLFGTFQNHELIHERGVIFTCFLCNRVFAKWKNLASHLKLHKAKLGPKNYRIALKESKQCKSDKEWKCSQCDQVYNARYKLNQHMKNKHEQNEATVCPYCGKRFTSESGAQRHVQLHLTPLHCSLCKEECQSREELQEHMKTRHYFESKICPICNVAQGSKRNFSAHVKKFHGDTPEGKEIIELLKVHKCDLCSRKFEKSFHLKRHLRSHDNGMIEKFKCSVCDSKFNNKQQLFEHIQSKHGENIQHQCQKCETKFSTEKELATHRKLLHKKTCLTKHFDDKEETCLTKQFDDKEDAMLNKSSNLKLDSHVKLSRPCKKMKVNSNPLNVHKTSEDVKSKSLSKNSSTRTNKTSSKEEDKATFLGDLFNLNKTSSCSMTSVKSKLYKCSECGERFNRESTLKKHSLVHNEDVDIDEQIERINNIQHLSFKCDECGNMYTSKLGLSTHTKQKHPEVSLSSTEGTLGTPTKSSDTVTEGGAKSGTKTDKKVQEITKPRTKELLTYQDTIQADKQGMYPCTQCLAIYKTYAGILHHKQSRHPQGPAPLKVPVSPSKVSKSGRVIKKSRKTLDTLQCDICYKQFSLEGSLLRHMVKKHLTGTGADGDDVHAVKTSVCNFCNKAFKNLRIHIYHKHADYYHSYKNNKEHTENMDSVNGTYEEVSTLYKCDICGEVYQKMDELHVHVATEHENQQNKTVKSKSVRYTCKVCSKSFKTRNALIIHTDKSHHTLISCSFCEKSFKTEKAAASHAKTHKKGVQCTKCFKTFKWESKLKKHMRDHHQTPALLVCGICDKVFPDYESVQYHLEQHKASQNNQKHLHDTFDNVQKVHGTRFTEQELKMFCDICKQSFGKKKLLLEHMLIHTSIKPNKDQQNSLSLKKKPILKNKNQIIKPCGKNKDGFNSNTIDIEKRIKKSGLHDKKAVVKTSKSQAAKSSQVGEHELKCIHCKKQFNNTHTMQVHVIKIHKKISGLVKDRYCKECKILFKSKTNHQQHQKNVHRKHKLKTKLARQEKASKCDPRKEKTFKCDHCDKSLRTLIGLKIHKRLLHHGQKDARETVNRGIRQECILCVECQQLYRSELEYKEHLRTLHSAVTMNTDGFTEDIMVNGFEIKRECDNIGQFGSKIPVVTVETMLDETEYQSKCVPNDQTDIEPHSDNEIPSQQVVHEEQEMSHEINLVDQNKFFCNACTNHFSTKQDLVEHLKTSHSETVNNTDIIDSENKSEILIPMEVACDIPDDRLKTKHDFVEDNEAWHPDKSNENMPTADMCTAYTKQADSYAYPISCVVVNVDKSLMNRKQLFAVPVIKLNRLLMTDENTGESEVSDTLGIYDTEEVNVVREIVDEARQNAEEGRGDVCIDRAISVSEMGNEAV